MTTHVTIKPAAITIPFKLVSEANAREHWRPKARRVSAQRRMVQAVLSAYQVRLTPPAVVTLTRIGKRKLDSDNLAISFKHFRDQIAEHVGVDDRHEHIVRYEYAQEVGKEYAVRIEFAPMGADNQNGGL